MERNAALKQLFRLEKITDAGLLTRQHVTHPCLYFRSVSPHKCFNNPHSFFHQQELSGELPVEKPPFKNKGFLLLQILLGITYQYREGTVESLRHSLTVLFILSHQHCVAKTMELRQTSRHFLIQHFFTHSLIELCSLQNQSFSPVTCKQKDE